MTRFGIRVLFTAMQGTDVNVIERAFQLAPSCASMSELRRALHSEGHLAVNAHLSGLGTQRELRKLYNDGAGTKKRGPKRQSIAPDCMS